MPLPTMGVTFLNMMQASLATCCEFTTGLHIVGSGICALLEMRAETVQKWTLFRTQAQGPAKMLLIIYILFTIIFV